MSKEKTFELEEPIEYAFKGEPVVGTFITLKAPTSKNMTECATLKQAFFRAMTTIPKSNRESAVEDGEGKDTIDGAAIMSIITMSSSVELAQVLAVACTLFTSGVALIDGEVSMTKPLVDKMSQDDLERMTGFYLENFILASALRKLNES